MIPFKNPPLVLLVSAPSGAGKTTLCDRLVGEFDSIAYSVSCTTRPPREGEIDGKSYSFLSADEFEQRVAAGDFLEHARVHDNDYGTLKQSVREALNRRRDVLMDIDVQGAAQIRRFARDGVGNEWIRDVFVDVFIAPPSLQELQRRLCGRGKGEPEVIQRRLERAADELQHWNEYQYVIVNNRLDDSYQLLRSILLAEQHRVRHTDLHGKQ